MENFIFYAVLNLAGRLPNQIVFVGQKGVYAGFAVF